MKLVVLKNGQVPYKEYAKVLVDYKDRVTSSSRLSKYVKIGNNEYRFVTEEQARGWGNIHPKISVDEFYKEVGD